LYLRKNPILPQFPLSRLAPWPPFVRSIAPLDPPFVAGLVPLGGGPHPVQTLVVRLGAWRFLLLVGRGVDSPLLGGGDGGGCARWAWARGRAMLVGVGELGLGWGWSRCEGSGWSWLGGAGRGRHGALGTCRWRHGAWGRAREGASRWCYVPRTGDGCDVFSRGLS